MSLYTMQAAAGVAYGGAITGTPSGTVYTPSSAGVITNVALADVTTLQGFGYYVIPSAGAGSSTGNASAGQSNHVVAGAGGTSTGGNGDGGAGGDVLLQPGAAGVHNGSGTDGRAGQVVCYKGDGTAGLPTADPHVLGALWSNAGVVTVSAG